MQIPRSVSVQDKSSISTERSLESRTRCLKAVLALVATLVCNSSEARSEALQGHLEHKRKMPPVGKMLKPGIHYDETADKPQSNSWVRIPAWLAGVWSSREETAIFRENFQTGQKSNEHHTFTARSKFGYGKQVDKTGQIWHYVGVPYTSDTQMAHQIEYHQVLEKEVTQPAEHQVAVRTKVIVVKVKRPSGDIAETYQQESITQYTDNPNGYLTMDSSTKAFNAAGAPVSLTKNKARIEKIANFEIINEEYGKDLKALFREYLTAQGLTSLLPDSGPALGSRR